MSALGTDAEIVLWRLSAKYLVPKIRPEDIIAFTHEGVVVAVGVYTYSTSLNTTDAWEYFEQGLGMETRNAFSAEVRSRQFRGSDQQLSIVNCRIVTEFRRLDPAWSLALANLPEADSSGFLCSAVSAAGQLILAQSQAQQPQMRELSEGAPAISDLGWHSVRAGNRPGQKRFQERAFANYGGRCVVSNESATPALIAAHIHRFALSGNHDLTNALLLRADLHNLFDRGYWTIDRQGYVRFSSKMSVEFPDSFYLTAFGGKRLRALQVAPICPDSAVLDWHRSEVYLDRNDPRLR